MTAEEAIKKVRRVKGIYAYESDYEAFDVAIKALEKQIPKKAVGEHYAHMRCPLCNHRIPSGQGSSSRRRDNWCNYCGQAIDWSEKDDERRSKVKS